MKNYQGYIFNCYLCNDAPCAKVCKHLDLDRILLGVRLKNERYIASILPKTNPCLKCKGDCEKSCLCLNKVNIKDLIKALYELKKECPTIKLDPKKIAVDFFGKKIDNPFMLSSSCVSASYEQCVNAFKAGWSGVCYKTLTYSDIHETSPRFAAIKNRDNTIAAFKNIEQLSTHSVKENLAIFRKLKKQFPNKIIIASIMGRNEKEWAKLAHECELAGADAIELNLSCPNMNDKKLGSSIGQVPSLIEKYTKAVKKAVKIPVLSKLTPNVQEIIIGALAAKKGHTDGVTAINTVKSLIDPKTNNIKFAAIGGLSGNAVRPLALKAISEIKQNKNTKDLYISATGGCETFLDAINFFALGANSIQITTAIMEYGYRIIDDLKNGLLYYMQTNGIKNLDELIGSELNKVVTLQQCPRDIVNFPQFDYAKCVGCGRCYISCRDGGHDAITLTKDKKPILNAKKCVGCHLCKIVCPINCVKSNINSIKVKNIK